MSAVLEKTSEIYQWIELALGSENIDEICDASLEGSTEVGDGYTGQVIFVQVKAKKGKNFKKYDLAVKKSTQDPKIRKNINIKEAYGREIYTFSTVLPKFHQLELKCGIAPFDKIPKYYGGYIFDTNEFLVFENLKSLGYKNHNLQEFMDKKHRKLTLESYSHWHALSYALKNKKPEVFSKLFDSLLNPYDKVHKNNDIQNFMQGARKLTCDILKERGESELCKQFEEIVKDGFLTILTNLFKEGKKDTHSVFAHSDCWHNNFMFKYESATPTKVVILDFQQATIMSVVFDLAYHLYYVTPTEEIPYIKEDLRYYHQQLSKKLEDLQCDVSKILPFEELVVQWKKYSILGLLMCVTWLPNSMSDRDDMLLVLDSFSEDTIKILVDGMKPGIKKKVLDHIVAIVRHNIEENML